MCVLKKSVQFAPALKSPHALRATNFRSSLDRDVFAESMSGMSGDAKPATENGKGGGGRGKGKGKGGGGDKGGRGRGRGDGAAPSGSGPAKQPNGSAAQANGGAPPSQNAQPAPSESASVRRPIPHTLTHRL